MRQPPGRAQRRPGGERKSREERWSELLEVATQVFYEKGYEAASLQDIADRLGMLKGSLYYYIQSKEDLLYEVVNEVHQEGLATIEGLAAQEGPALERLRGVIVGHIEHECDTLTKTSVFLHELEALTPERQREVIGSGHAYRRVFSDLIAEGQKEGQIRAAVDPKLGALWILGSINWVYRWFRPGSGFSARQIGEHFGDMVVRGLAEPDVLAGMNLPEPSPAPRRRATRATTAKTAPAKTRAKAAAKPAPSRGKKA